MSIHPKTLELIHAELDGVATEAEQVLLRDAIARDTAVRDEYSRLRGLCDVLARVEPEEPPAQLAPSVMRGVRAHRNHGGGIIGRMRASWPGGRVALGYAYAVAAGAVIGILGLHLVAGGGFFGPVVPERDATATILPPLAADRLDLAPAGIRGVATLRPSAAGTAIGLDLDTTEPVEFVLRFDPGQEGGRVDVQVVRTGAAVDAGSLRLPRKD